MIEEDNVLGKFRVGFKHLKWEKMNWSNRVDQNLEYRILVFRSTGSARSGRPDLGRKRKKIKAVQKARWRF